MKPGNKKIAVILTVIAAFFIIAVFGIGDDIKGVRQMRYGIDIRGGVEAVFEPQNLNRPPTEKELKTAREVIEMRLDAQNITDREVTIDHDGGYLIVRFPWKSDEISFNPEDAIGELGDMAQLTFRNDQGNVLIEGKHIESSAVEKDNSAVNPEYIVTLNFDAEGARLFEEVTGSMVGEALGIYMDDTMISNPVVEGKIPGGQAIINGMENYQEAKDLSDKINSGALPFSLTTTSFSTISPTLGNHALEIMIFAGVAAFLVVCIFMSFYYKLAGMVACLTLFFQMILQLLSISVPQYTLTLPGIAGVILSLGMAVDANIIIAERISEELKKGCSVRTSIKNGYKNGFSSVLDGNITTAVVAGILMVFGSGSMLSFGYTLLMGMIINVIVGVAVSKQLLLSMTTFDRWNQERCFVSKREERTLPFYKNRWICAAVSGIILLVGIAGCVVKGVRLDTQFTGGAVLSYRLEGTADTIRLQKEAEQITGRAVTVQESKSHLDDSASLVLTLAGNSGITTVQQKEITLLVKEQTKDGEAELSQTYVVEPYIGEKALKNSGIAIGLSFAFIVLYVWFRFKVLSGLTAGLTALIALLHDVAVVFFVFVLFGIPLNDAFVAVILTIIGYSINDTIVVYDRIRENKKAGIETDILELNDRSISQVLARSVNTSFTTGVCAAAILAASVFFQIDSIFKFALPMLFGLVSGCYSSVCIASLLWAMWENRKEKKLKNRNKITEDETWESHKS